MNVNLRRLLVLSLLLALALGCNNDEQPGEGESATHTVGPEGGTVQSDDGEVSIDFPEGALAESAELTISEYDGSAHDELHSGLYGFELDGSLEDAVTVSVQLREEGGGDIQLGRVGDGPYPMPVAGSSVEDGTVVAPLYSFSRYGAFDFDQISPGGGDYEAETTIDESGGTAESSDGNFSIEFGAGAFDEETEVTVTNISEQIRQDGGGADDEHDTDTYQVAAIADFDSIDELGASATVEIAVSSSGDESGRVIGMDRGLGVIPGSHLDGDVVTAEVEDLTDGAYAGVVFEMTQQCEDANPFGASCSDYDDCMSEAGASEDVLVCVCNDEEVTVGFSCHGDICEGPLGSCAGIGLGHDGFCDDAGGWSGDCYVE